VGRELAFTLLGPSDKALQLVFQVEHFFEEH
jgi:hypothetical protein